MDYIAALSDLRGLLNLKQCGNTGVKGVSPSQPSENAKFQDKQKYLEI